MINKYVSFTRMGPLCCKHYIFLIAPDGAYTQSANQTMIPFPSATLATHKTADIEQINAGY
jgi:hypothetical protein